MKRRSVVRGSIIIALSIALSSCRCRKETLAPVDVGAAFDPGEVGLEELLAPGWTDMKRGTLDNGALLQWLREPESTSFHLRILLPTGHRHAELDAAATAIMLRVLEMRLESRVRKLEARFSLDHGPGRIELSLHGSDHDAEALFALLAHALGDEGVRPLLPRAQGQVVAAHRTIDASDLASAALVSRLLNTPRAQELAEHDRLVNFGAERLERSWSSLLDPRDAVMIVHSGRSSSEFESAIETLTTRWRGKGLRTARAGVIERLRTIEARKSTRTTLLGAAEPSPLYAVGGARAAPSGRAVVMLGRVIPTPDAESRARARLVQRFLQEELDVRLLVSGDVSLFAMRIKLSSADPARSLTRELETLREHVGRKQRTDRLRLAAELWLGARVVDASLQGEDWTRLWSESIDLSGQDAEIPDALARDALAMLKSSSDEMLEFQKRWFDPKSGEPGWTWVVAGLDAEGAKALATTVKVVPEG